MLIAACVLGYVACSVASGYVMGRLELDFKHDADRSAAVFFAIATGPVGLVLATGYFAMAAGARKRELAVARHQLALKEIAQAEREISKLLGRGQ